MICKRNSTNKCMNEFMHQWRVIDVGPLKGGGGVKKFSSFPQAGMPAPNIIINERCLMAYNRILAGRHQARK